MEDYLRLSPLKPRLRAGSRMVTDRAPVPANEMADIWLGQSEKDGSRSGKIARKEDVKT